MIICIAGKNEIAVIALEFIVKNKPADATVVGLSNTGDDGINGWQPSFRFACNKLKVRIVTLEECYDLDDLLFLSLEFAKLIQPKKFRSTRLFNLHFSQLLAYKGSLTSIHPILNGDSHSEVTLHRIDEGIDTGKIIAQQSFSIEEWHNSRNLYALYNRYALALLKSNFNNLLHNSFTETVQPIVGSSFYSVKSISFASLCINLQKTAFEISNQIRAYAFREYQLPSIEGEAVYKSDLAHSRAVGKPGTIVYSNEDCFLVNAVDYQIKIYKDREAALFNAAMTGDIKEIEKVNASGFDIGVRNKQGWNILLVGCFNEHLPLVKHLVGNGFDINATNYKGTTALMYAKSAASRSGS